MSDGEEGLERPSESELDGRRLLSDVGEPASSRISIPGTSGADADSDTDDERLVSAVCMHSMYVVYCISTHTRVDS